MFPHLSPNEIDFAKSIISLVTVLVPFAALFKKT
jgi:hypothetical protein